MQKRILKNRIYLAIGLLVCLCLCQIQEIVFYTVSAAGYTEPVIAVQEIDLGDYTSQMTAGEKQLLNITILPVNATDQNITCSSSNPKVAKINGMGRITALKAGTTEIVVSCGGISEKFDLTVVEAGDTVRDLDLGDCPQEIEIGTSQLLNVTVIPTDAPAQAITYQSNDTGIATVNEIGRITGVAVGTATITVSCGKVKKDFSLKVVKAKSDEIPVRDIEIADHEDELEVDKTLILSVTVLPSDATNNTVTYKSSDKKIATVNSSGEVKGIAEGKVTITVSAGNITKKVELKVKVATSKIELDTTYLVMQSGETHQLTARVLPAEADQTIIFESVNPEVASVTGGGLVTANQCGAGTILVKNGDTSTAVTVIVNTEETEGKKESGEYGQTIEEKYENVITAKDYPVVTSDMLRYFYEQKEVLTVYGTGYIIKIDGEKIKNWDNELYTQLDLKEEEQGISFELNRSKKLCGAVTVQFDDDAISGKYVYLYNISKGKYEQLQEQNVKLMKLDTEGKYLITDKKLSTHKIKIVIFITALALIIILTVVYIVIKKRYWFW